MIAIRAHKGRNSNQGIDLHIILWNIVWGTSLNKLELKIVGLGYSKDSCGTCISLCTELATQCICRDFLDKQLIITL